MTRATKFADKPHARIYSEWLRLSAWLNISPHARALVVEMFASYYVGTNGKLEWPQSKVAKLLRCGNLKADAVMVELEKAGWIEVTRAGTFSGARLPTLYRLTWYDCSVTGEPASKAFLRALVPPPKVPKRNLTGANGHRTRCHQSSKLVLSGTGEASSGAPIRISEALSKSLKRKGLIR
jgi:hypothetical protein